MGNTLGSWALFAVASNDPPSWKSAGKLNPGVLPGGQEVQRTPDWPVARLRGVFNWVPVRGISDIPIKMPFPCKSYTGRLALLLSQSRNVAIMPTMGGHLPAQQPSCFPISQTLVLEAALTSKSVPDRQTRAAGFANWKDKIQFRCLGGQTRLGIAFCGLVHADLKGQSP